MDTKALRQKILDLAIRGKLVPQDPNDEPASVLLERIREQKKQMVKEGKLKAKDIKNDTIIFVGEDNLHYEKFQDGTLKCIEDEIPFALPEGWEWTRVGTVTFFVGGYAYKSNKYISDSQNLLIRIGNIKNNNIDPFVAKTCISDEYASETSAYLIRENDILFTMTGTRGKRDYFYSCRVDKNDLTGRKLFLNQRVGCLRMLDVTDIIPSYFVNAIQSSFVLDAIFATETGNVNQGNIGSTATMNLLVPIPPTKEQNRIQEKLVTILTTIERYDIDRENLLELIQMTKSKILDRAIRGKLVPQDSNDEPASVLLERIRAEKEELIKQGKIKRDKKESIIFRGDDNSYYRQTSNLIESISDWELDDIPDNWVLCCLEELCDYGNCNNVEADSIAESAWILDLEDIEKDTGKVLRKIRKNERDFTSTKHSFYEGQVLYSKLRPYLNKVIIADEDGFCTSEILPLEFANVVLPQYALYYLMSPTFLRYANQCSYGVKMPRLGTADGRKAIFPLPPIEEQYRIANNISRYFIQIDNILAALL